MHPARPHSQNTSSRLPGSARAPSMPRCTATTRSLTSRKTFWFVAFRSAPSTRTLGSKGSGSRNLSLYRTPAVREELLRFGRIPKPGDRLVVHGTGVLAVRLGAFALCRRAPPLGPRQADDDRGRRDLAAHDLLGEIVDPHLGRA